ncbi:conjugal transfer protein TraN [Escherichia coli]|uniref:conjugal transfer protein TraN n=1 Tax=Escherichia coli TaxID=562 RepID=UPI00098C68DE|nr:conjugal transfer protein TraN [Escherichia coli]
MASINTIVKRKQYLWLGIVVVGTASAIGGALYLSDVDMSGNGETVAEQEPVPDMTGVVDTTFDDKVRQHATTEMQVTAAQMQKQYEEIRRELDVLNKQRGDDQRRIEKLGQDNAALAEQVKALGANPVTATGEPVPQMPASPPGPEGEPQPGNTPVVQQQGRNGQLRISFGSAKHPDCRGITVDELQKIQFNRLDFTNFYEDLMNNKKIPDSGVLTQKVKEQIADQLKQAGQ